MKESFKKIGLVFLAGAIAFVIFGIALICLSFIADYFKSNNRLELWLFVDSFLKPIALVFASGWLWLSGKLLKKSNPIKLGYITLIIYLVVAIFPYLLSFLVTPA